MIRFDWSDSTIRAQALARPRGRGDDAMLARVRLTLDEVRREGWEALARIAEEIDGTSPERLEVAPFAAEARKQLRAEAQAAMRLAAKHIETFHRRTLPEPEDRQRNGCVGERAAKSGPSAIGQSGLGADLLMTAFHPLRS